MGLQNGTNISIVIPVYNARECLAELVRRLEETRALLEGAVEIILLDDCSVDGSFVELERLKAAGADIRIVQNDRNIGQHRTLVRGLGLAGGAISVILDCDLQDPPELIPRLVSRLEAGGADAVIVRYGNYANGFLRYLMSRGNRVLRAFRGQGNSDPHIAVYRAFSAAMKRQLLDRYRPGMKLRDVFDPRLFRIEFFDAHRSRRFAGKSSYTLSTLLQSAFGRR